MPDNQVNIDILGTSFVVEADESPDYLQKVIAIYKEKVKSVQLGMSTADPLKIAILSGILVTDEFLKLKGELSSDDAAEIEKLTARIIERIDESLYNNQ